MSRALTAQKPCPEPRFEGAHALVPDCEGECERGRCRNTCFHRAVPYSRSWLATYEHVGLFDRAGAERARRDAARLTQARFGQRIDVMFVREHHELGVSIVDDASVYGWRAALRAARALRADIWGNNPERGWGRHAARLVLRDHRVFDASER